MEMVQFPHYWGHFPNKRISFKFLSDILANSIIIMSPCANVLFSFFNLPEFFDTCVFVYEHLGGWWTWPWRGPRAWLSFQPHTCLWESIWLLRCWKPRSLIIRVEEEMNPFCKLFLLSGDVSWFLGQKPCFRQKTLLALSFLLVFLAICIFS